MYFKKKKHVVFLSPAVLLLKLSISKLCTSMPLKLIFKRKTTGKLNLMILKIGQKDYRTCVTTLYSCT